MLGLALPWLVIIVIFTGAVTWHILKDDEPLLKRYEKKH